MGMSASQARLIALTARMNDIEYQGQQINQQRTTLSNQINELYNSLLDMAVPTPPSTQDFTKIQYSGTVNASSFALESVTPKSDGKYNLNLSFAQSGNIVSKTTKATTVVSTPTQISVKAATSSDDIKKFFEVKHTSPQKTSPYRNGDELEAAYEQDNNANLMIELSSDKKNLITDDLLKNPCVQVYIKDSNNLDYLSELPITSTTDLQGYNGTIYVVCNVADIIGDEGHINTNSDITKLIEPNLANITNAYSWENQDWTTTKTEFTSDDASYLVGKNLLIRDGDGVRYLKSSDVNANLTIEQLYIYDKHGAPMYNTESSTEYSKKNSDGSTSPLYKLSEYKGISKTEYDALVESLHHSFPEIDEKEIPNSFYVYREDEEWKFVKVTDTVKITDSNDGTNYCTTYAPSTGTYKETKLYENCEISFDNDGRINKIYIQMGDDIYEVDMKAETVTDQDAYKDAFNQYEFDKYKYDKEQERINVQTSIIQSEDKNLELKLTRLDNERNAVNTEIEAVKKVVDDNIQKSFKTFSG